VIIISLDSESGRKPRVKKEDIQVKFGGLENNQSQREGAQPGYPSSIAWVEGGI